MKKYEIRKTVCIDHTHDIPWGMLKPPASIAGTCQHLWNASFVRLSSDRAYQTFTDRGDGRFLSGRDAALFYFSYSQPDGQHWAYQGQSFGNSWNLYPFHRSSHGGDRTRIPGSDPSRKKGAVSI